MKKKFIKVIAEHNTDGTTLPIQIDWEGRKLAIDKVLDIRQAASLKSGGAGNTIYLQNIRKASILI